MSVLVDVAEAVKGRINAQLPGLGSPAVREHVPLYDLSTQGLDVKVSVVPKDVRIDRESRQAARWEIEIDVGVQRRVATAGLGEIDAMHGVVESVQDVLYGADLATTPVARFRSSAISPILVPDHVERMNTYTSVITVTYRVTR